MLHNVPRITDIAIMAEVLRRLGCTVRGRRITSGLWIIDAPAEPGTETDYDLVRRLRASICVLGPLLARRGYVRVAHPGGDAIGSRGLDMHVAGLARMGAEISGEHGFIIAAAPTGLHGATIWLDFPSVGATENLLMAAVLADGVTEIDNAAREPEIVDICAMLTGMGAHISGAGTSKIEVVEGVPELRPGHPPHDRRPDRGRHLGVRRGDDPRRRHRGRDRPGVPRDRAGQGGHRRCGRRDVGRTASGCGWTAARPPWTSSRCRFPASPPTCCRWRSALASVSDGASMITENIFDGRFMFVQEVVRLGAEIRTDGKHAVVRGRERLSAAPVRATDIRAGAGLVIAALCADGVTEVSHVHHIDRGYPYFVERPEPARRHSRAGRGASRADVRPVARRPAA